MQRGVFLWARLVVRSLLNGIGHRANPRDLRKRLDRIPKGLDELFDSIFDSIDPEDRPLSDKLFLIAIKGIGKWEEPCDAMTFSRLEDLDDPNFPQNRPMRPQSQSEINEHIMRMPYLLDRFSKGLIEIKPQPKHTTEDHNEFHYRIEFYHRTVYEYIVGARQREMEIRNPGFDALASALRLAVANIKFLNLPDFQERPDYKEWTKSRDL
ncbi:hypothetical protein N7468_003767 [Penicillium chermesinum]|uniref:DUF7791 domain-containing protein n=1 Tax=Penicillium chermesinum TaxID=63820 RepID=A0A9W9P747_9EURO|nr:uncharacterized protein N7468_003767 [Penicillium chermesinum]KAJ5239148.1 hypothetical protein N7468_003767 [Penicillium chermesinum]